MTETKLEKINQFFYREPYKEGRSFKWLKAFHQLDMRLSDVRVIRGLSVQQPLATNPVFLEEAEVRAGLTTYTSTSGSEGTHEKYSDHFCWRLEGTGYFVKDRIGLIKKDGTITADTETFNQVDVFIRSVSDAEKEKVRGTFFYMNREMAAQVTKKAGARLTLDLYAPETRLERLCQEFLASPGSQLEVVVDVDMFMSEVDATWGEPLRRRDYYIEEESSRNDAYISTIDVCQTPDKDRKESSGDLVSAQMTILKAINARLASIRTVGILVVVALLLMLLLK